MFYISKAKDLKIKDKALCNEMSEARSSLAKAGKRFRTQGISKRVRNIIISPIKEMQLLQSEVEGTISFGQGVPSFNTPANIRKAAIDAINQNKADKYLLMSGMLELKREIAKSLKKNYGAIADYKKEIFVSVGAMEAIMAAIMTTVGRGDEVILFTPCFSSHIEQVLLAEGKPIFVPLIEEQGWKLDVDKFKKAITKKTKAVIICNPSNPTGTLFSENELNAIANIAKKRKLFIITDETYDYLVYDNNKYFSLCSRQDLNGMIISCFSFSKKYAMTGYRVGFMYADEGIIDHVLKVHDATTIVAPAVSQYAALEALQGPQHEPEKFVVELQKRRDLICKRLDRLKKVFFYQKPQGAYYIFPKIKIKNVDAIQFCLDLLYKAKVVAVPGDAFGHAGKGHLRLSFACSREEINEGFDRLEKYFKEIGLI